MAADDPYCYPGSTVLRNKLGLRDPEALERVQDERAAARYAILQANLPRPPFTVDTLKSIHRMLLGSVYDWAGEPRTIGIRKADYDDANGTFTHFAEAASIPGMARVIFRTIDDGRALLNLDRATFATRAAEFLNDLNLLHPFREGNGRSQRLLLSAMAESAGHPLSWDVVTRERMVATSIAARDDTGSFARLIEEISDPRGSRRSARRSAPCASRPASPGTTSTSRPPRQARAIAASSPAGQERIS